jgi:hypothetical protein
MCGRRSNHAITTLSVTAQDARNSSTYLTLDEVGRNNLAAISIEERQSGAEGGCGDTPKDSLGNHTSPARLRLVDS